MKKIDYPAADAPRGGGTRFLAFDPTKPCDLSFRGFDGGARIMWECAVCGAQPTGSPARRATIAACTRVKDVELASK